MAKHALVIKTLFLYLLFVVYGSLVPFDFSPHPLHEAWTSFTNIRHLHLGIGSRADLIANFVLYLPLGFLASANWLRTKQLVSSKVLKSLAIIVGCTALAVGIEFTQIFFKPRTVSLNDLQSETLGSIGGLVLWLFLGSRFQKLSDDLKKHGLVATRATLFTYLLAYLSLSFFPYDFLISSSEIAWKLGTDHYHLILSPASCSSAAVCVGKLTSEVFAAAPIGLLISILVSTPENRLRFALLAGFLLGVLIELMQFLLASGISQGLSVLTRMLGILIGLRLYDLIQSDWLSRAQRSRYLKASILVSSTFYFLIVMWLTWSSKGQWLNTAQATARLREIRFLPFYYHYFTSEPVALSNLLYYAAVYFPVGLLYWLWNLPRVLILGPRHAVAAAIFGAVAAFVIEAGKLFLSGTHPDPTNALIGFFSAMAGFVLANRLFRWTSASVS